MGLSVARSRHLRPENLHQEIFLKFNLPPFHILKQSGFIAKIAEHWRNTGEFSLFRKYKKKSGLKNKSKRFCRIFQKKGRSKLTFSPGIV